MNTVLPTITLVPDGHWRRDDYDNLAHTLGTLCLAWHRCEQHGHMLIATYDLVRADQVINDWLQDNEREIKTSIMAGSSEFSGTEMAKIRDLIGLM